MISMELNKTVKKGYDNSLEMEFEAILSVPMCALEQKHGEDSSDYPYLTEKSYETGSNVDGWK